VAFHTRERDGQFCFVSLWFGEHRNVIPYSIYVAHIKMYLRRWPLLYVRNCETNSHAQLAGARQYKLAAPLVCLNIEVLRSLTMATLPIWTVRKSVGNTERVPASSV
jgi:hypothetical protein